jgi:predicted DNA repair protein MutK
MFLVGGGIVVHGIAPLHHAIEQFAASQPAVLQALVPMVANLVLGFVIGAVVVAVMKGVERLRGNEK